MRRIGFFGALYRKMTLAVQAGIAANRFQDGARMERFDVNFANLYLSAWNQFQRGQRPSRSWQVAFEMAANNDLLILQLWWSLASSAVFYGQKPAIPPSGFASQSSCQKLSAREVLGPLAPTSLRMMLQ